MAEGSRARAPWWRRPRAVPSLIAVLALLLAAGLIGYPRLTAPRVIAGTGVHAPASDGASGRSPTDQRADAVNALLDARAAALRDRDKDAFLATIDPEATGFRAEQAYLFDNLAGVPLSTWEYRLDPRTERPDPNAVLASYGVPAWAPGVTLSYALDGFDPVPTERPMLYTFTERADHWYLAADDDFDTADAHTWRGLWDFGPIAVHQGQNSLMLSHPGNEDRLASFASVIDQAIPAVTGVWGSNWVGRVVVLFPDTEDEMSQMIGDEFAVDSIAAVATADYTEISDTGDGTVRGQRVVINPANLSLLTGVGRQIVLTHEVTHIATRSVTGERTPTWLIEGFADYVAYSSADVPVPVAARELADEVRAGTVPDALPGDDEFAGTNPRLSEVYEEAWMACRVLADELGRDGLVEFYRQVGISDQAAPGSVDRALSDLSDVTYDQFVAEFRDRVVGDLS